MLRERNSGATPQSRLDWRIGIHQGDIVVEEDGDIFGDGVNVAARLEGLAEPGGICVSARVQEDAAGKLDLVFRDLGEQQLKNIARQVRAYAIDLGIVPVPAVATVPRLSIVVLPFANLNNDPEQQYFADGITEDLTTDLSRIDGMLVISRNTAFTYQGRRIDTRQIGRELGVRYALEGSVRRSGNQVRINAQLIDAETDRHLWAERFDGDVSDLFAVQDEVTGRIANALDVEVVTSEAARPTEHPDALDYILRGRAVRAKGQTRENCAEAINLFERALALAPASVEAQIMLMLTLTSRVLDNMSSSPIADLERAEGLSRQTVSVSPRSSLAHHGKGQLLRAQGRYEEAVTEYETAVTLDRNAAASIMYLAWCKFVAGFEEDTIVLCEKAVRLSPRDSLIGVWYNQIGMMLLYQSRIGEAITWFEKARSANPGLAYVRAMLASAYALKGETGRTSAELTEARRLAIDGRYRSINQVKAVPLNNYPSAKVQALREATFVAGLRKAGMPEE
ncbi:MAG: adenylate/guanylate cyclase domain-containing protein [Alphaproteobacteria bacterium]|nr:adenylate/guanylate cyclase domain-containing protein [Alphaproteobacteria bacterium]